jgi:hypothetical protein
MPALSRNRQSRHFVGIEGMAKQLDIERNQLEIALIERRESRQFMTQVRRLNLKQEIIHK